jgi:hypothetical protein
METKSWDIMKGNEEILKIILEEERRKSIRRQNVSVCRGSDRNTKFD